MEHHYYAARGKLTNVPPEWQAGKRVAVCVVVSLEHYPLDPPKESQQSPEVPGGRAATPFPDIVTHSTYEYGMRVGLFRVLELARRYGIRLTVALDAATALNYPYVVDKCRELDAEFIAHGLSVRQLITSALTEQQEEDYIAESVKSVEKAVGQAPLGWLGTEFSESWRTPRLLAKAGIRYVLDWANDELPYEMTVPDGRLIAVPMMAELDDVYMHLYRRVPIWTWAQCIRDSYDQLATEAASQGRRAFVVNLHPWVIGQPYRIASLENVLAHLQQSDSAWTATVAQMLAAYHAESVSSVRAGSTRPRHVGR